MVQVEQNDLVKIHSGLTAAVDGGDIVLAVDALDIVNSIMQEEENGSEDTTEVSDSGDSEDEAGTDPVDPVAV